MRLFSVEGAGEEENDAGESAGSPAGAGATRSELLDDAADCRRNGYVHVSGSFRMTHCRHGGPCSSHWFYPVSDDF
jgi:hypothetical protein